MDRLESGRFVTMQQSHDGALPPLDDAIERNPGGSREQPKEFNNIPLCLVLLKKVLNLPDAESHYS